MSELFKKHNLNQDLSSQTAFSLHSTNTFLLHFVNTYGFKFLKYFVGKEWNIVRFETINILSLEERLCWLCLTNIHEMGYIQCLEKRGLYPADTKTLQRRRRNVLILVSKTSQIRLKWKLQRPFFKTSSGHLPGDVLKTSSRKRPQDIFQETSSRRLPGDVLKMSSTRRPQDLLKTPEDFKTFSGK